MANEIASSSQPAQMFMHTGQFHTKCQILLKREKQMELSGEHLSLETEELAASILLAHYIDKIFVNIRLVPHPTMLGQRSSVLGWLCLGHAEDSAPQPFK